MIYKGELTIPAETTYPSTETAQLPITSGIVKQVFITFPGGLAGLVGVRVRVRERVLWPSNPDVWFVGSGETFDFVENLAILDQPFYLTLEGYNNDCVYPHTVHFSISQVREEADLISTILSGRPLVGVPDVGAVG